MGRKKRKKIYYIPGILSLTIIPFVFIYFANKEIKARTLTVLPIYLADITLLKKFPEWFTKFGGHFPPRRNYVDINFTGNYQYDKTKLDFAQLRIREILSQNDSINGIHFKFGDSSQYWTFVKAIDILRHEGAKSYMPLDNDLWFYDFAVDTTTKASNYIGTLDNDAIIIEPKKSWWTKVKGHAQNVWKNSSQIIISFSVFLLFIAILQQKNNGR